MSKKRTPQQLEFKRTTGSVFVQPAALPKSVDIRLKREGYEQIGKALATQQVAETKQVDTLPDKPKRHSKSELDNATFREPGKPESAGDILSRIRSRQMKATSDSLKKMYRQKYKKEN